MSDLSVISRRDLLRHALLASGGCSLFGNSAFAGEPESYPGLEDAFDAAFGGYEALPYEVPSRFHVDQQLLVDGVSYGTSPPFDERSFQVQASAQLPSCGSTVVRSLEEAKLACSAALRSGQYDVAQVAVARWVTDSQGRQVLVFDKDPDGYVKPSVIYRPGQVIGQVSMSTDRQRDDLWAAFLAEAKGGDGGSALGALSRYDRQHPTDFHYDDPYHYVGLFSGRSSRRRPSAGAPCAVQCQPMQRNQCGYNCDLRPRSTLRGLLSFEFLRPLRSAGGIRHLPLRRRLVARLFPRIAYNNGWINCETAHLLLVKRLFWGIVIGVGVGVGPEAGGAGAAGGSGGGGGGGAGAGIIFLG